MLQVQMEQFFTAISETSIILNYIWINLHLIDIMNIQGDIFNKCQVLI